MDILIKGMEMPKACGYCFAYDDEYCQCSLEPSYDGQWSRDNHCPLVELPPHGRLIDGDHLKGIIGYLDVDFSSQDMCQVRRAIDNAPVILEAST